MRPHDIGFDEYYGYYPAQKEVSQGVDPRRYPDLVLNKELFEAFESIKPDNHLIHGFKGRKTEKLSQIKSIEDIGRADQVLTDFSIEKIKEISKPVNHFLLNIVL